MRIALSILAVCLAVPAVAQAQETRPLSLRLAQQPGDVDISGVYGETSPVAVMFRDAAFGLVLGAAGGAVIGLAADNAHWGRDTAIGAGVGLLLGAVVGAFDAQSSGIRIGVHADRDGPGGTLGYGRSF